MYWQPYFEAQAFAISKEPEIKRRHVVAAATLLWPPSILLAQGDDHGKETASAGKLQIEWRIRRGLIHGCYGN